jgi:hypothetical protein
MEPLCWLEWYELNGSIEGADGTRSKLEVAGDSVLAMTVVADDEMDSVVACFLGVANGSSGMGNGVGSSTP